MSIDMYLEQSQAQAASAKAMAEQEIQAYEALEAALSEFEASQDELKGQTYNSARQYSQAVLRPLFNGAKQLAQMVGQAATKFPEAYIEQVANESLKEWVLEEQIAEINLRISNAREAMSSMHLDSHKDRDKIDTMNRMLDLAETSKRELEDKLDKLRAFNASSPAIFAEIDALKAMVYQGLAQLDKSWDSKTGTFQLPKDMGVFTRLNTKAATAISEAKKQKELIVNEYMESYGFDRKTAETLYKLQQKIIKKAKKEGWTNEDVIYEYNRIVASFVDNYQAARWTGVCGTIKDDAELDKLCKEYGLSKSEIKRLHDSIPDQHSGKYNSTKDLAHEAVQLAGFTNRSALDAAKGGLKSFGANIASELGNLGLEQYELSFKGDVDSGRYDDTDFNSDLDAINIYAEATSSSTPIDNVFSVGAKYNKDVRTNKVNRVDKFYETMGGGNRTLGKIATGVILNIQTPGEWWIDKGYSYEEKQKHKGDFWDYMERGEDKNVGT